MITQAQYVEMLFRQAPKQKAEGARVMSNSVTHEADLHNAILTECNRRGWIALHGSMAQATARTIGEPDFVCLADDGRVFFIECKAKAGKLSPAQQAFRAWAAKLGHTVHIVRSMAEFLQIVK